MVKDEINNNKKKDERNRILTGGFQFYHFLVMSTQFNNSLSFINFHI